MGCGASKEGVDSKVTNNLMQFLMELNVSFDHVRNQILMMEPLPNVTKAYSMVLQGEYSSGIDRGCYTGPGTPALILIWKTYGLKLTFTTPSLDTNEEVMSSSLHTPPGIMACKRWWRWWRGFCGGCGEGDLHQRREEDKDGYEHVSKGAVHR
ncbi:UNVERIFIED_CONTAM: hypothetical protein Scaly_2877300 [Sesamum calycinum]|uniref:Uncharacterized protein n=1 Tax=Sesamum calycinum TaxID=2727403 RepID=A0AAW2LA74_9LAMI